MMITLDTIPKVRAGKPEPGEFSLYLHDPNSRYPIDSIGFHPPYDEKRANEVAARQRFGKNGLVVVTNHEGSATAAYINGEKVA